MKKQDNKALKQYLTHFNRDAVFSYEGKEYSFSEQDFEELFVGSNYWHGNTDPSTWLCASLVGRGRRLFGEVLSREQVLTLCADTLNISLDRLEQALEWNAHYLGWHDGMDPDDCHAWPKTT